MDFEPEFDLANGKSKRKFTARFKLKLVLKVRADGWQLKTGLATYFEFYNHRLFHQFLHRSAAEVLKDTRQSASNKMKSKINQQSQTRLCSLSGKVVRFKGRSVQERVVDSINQTL